MKLHEYVAKLGDAAFAAKTGLTERAAKTYRLRQRLPLPDAAAIICEKTPLRLADIYYAGARRAKRPRPAPSR
jgi:hypothetical protein